MKFTAFGRNENIPLPPSFFPFFGSVPINIGGWAAFWSRKWFIGECRLPALSEDFHYRVVDGGWCVGARWVWGRLRSSSTRCSKNNTPPPPITRSRACKRETGEFYLYLCVWANVGRDIFGLFMPTGCETIFENHLDSSGWREIIITRAAEFRYYYAFSWIFFTCLFPRLERTTRGRPLLSFSVFIR